MKFSISNLAWQKKDEPEIFNYLKSINITGIELSLTKIWPNWEGLNFSNALEYKWYLNSFGFEIAAVQAIFYQKNFESLLNESEHFDILSHLNFISDLAEIFNCEVIILGAPRLRIMSKSGDTDELLSFNKLIDNYISNSNRSVKLCIEALGANYGNVLIKNHSELINFIDNFDSNKLGFHVDSATLKNQNENISELILKRPVIDHYHISENDLTGYHKTIDEHIKKIILLEKIKYNNWCSFEIIKPNTLLDKAGIFEITSYFRDN